MGVDSVEILMKVEQTFNIRIPDQEAQQILKVGDLHDAVWRHLSGKQSNKCQSQKLFYQLRRSFADKYKFPSACLSVATQPGDVFPAVNRREEYLKFSKDTSLELPNLVLSEFWQAILTGFGIVTIAGGLTTALVMINFLDYSNWTLLIPVAGLATTLLFSALLDHKRTAIQGSTMRDFIQQTVALNYSRLVSDEGTNRPEMESLVNHIIADHVGIDLKEVKAEKKIGDDLGID